jgi:hypothetical protein
VGVPRWNKLLGPHSFGALVRLAAITVAIGREGVGAGAGEATRAFLHSGGSIDDSKTGPRGTCRTEKEGPRRNGVSSWPTVNVLNRNTGCDKVWWPLVIDKEVPGLWYRGDES